MKLETVMKLVKQHTNVLGYANSKTLMHDIQDCLECLELRISIIRDPQCTVSNQEIINNIILPIVTTKDCMCKESRGTVFVFSRSLIKLRVIDRACCLINSQLSSKYGFTIITNYDVLNEEHATQDIN